MSFCNSISVLALLSMVAMLVSGQASYNTNTQVCCNGTVTDRGSSLFMSCCGNNPFDYTKSLCCPQNQIVDILDSNNRSHDCCYDQATKTSTYYNYDTEQCCDGLVLNKPNQTLYYGCCNGQLFNIEKELCCGGVLQKLDDEEACCGEQQVYDTKSEMCCQQYGFDDAGIYRVLDFTLTDADRGTSNCCGLQVYNQTTEACCDGVVKPKIGNIGRVTWGQCCGGEPYDSNTQFCCTKWGEIAPQEYGTIETKLYDIEEGASACCCGLTLYDYREELCCSDETVIAKPEDSDKDEWMSCCGDQVITNHTTQFCHNNTIYERESYNYYVCGEEMYDQRLQHCCGVQLYDPTSTMQCCYGANEAFNSTTHKCCYNVVEEMTEEDREYNNNAWCTVEYYNTY